MKELTEKQLGCAIAGLAVVALCVVVWIATVIIHFIAKFW